ncbi:Leucine-rich repeat (LRR) protein [Fragilaria crotonensis]|nr:Leucine-rich repeat (LRR) protein [Fragilaria crotonensis]
MVSFHRCLLGFLAVLCFVPSQADVPVNDQCDNAISLSSSDQTLLGTTLNATKDSLNNCGENFVNSPGVWYVVPDASESRIVRISTCTNATNFDTAITVYGGSSCESQLCVGGRDNDGECGTADHTTISWQTTPGQNYYVLIHGSQEENVGDFGLLVTVEDPLPDSNSDKHHHSAASTLFLSPSPMSILLFGIGANLIFL